MRFVFINDDPDDIRQWLGWAERNGHEAQGVGSALEADRLNADFYVFDISAVAGLLQPEQAYSPICSIATNHPGATMVIVSAVPKPCVDDLCEDVYVHIGVRPINGGWGTYTQFEKALEGLL